MSLVDIPWNPTPRMLRQFGMLALLALPLLGWMFLGRPNLLADSPNPSPATSASVSVSVFGSPQVIVLVLAAIGAFLAVLSWFQPRWVRPVFVGSCLVTYPIGLVLSELVLLIVFLGVFWPIALIFRLLGRDPLQRGLEPSSSTYWQEKTQITDPRRYFRQY